ncbi:MAG TPA: hypothetical protein PKD09_07440 [Aggregatilinea sp.]|jgi:hypothetical protein|uniref:hypothetical protein n=1 Tax=Aggregatilinea sp. TaxID=2806333 RepID=UPI002D1A5F0E|nr:hypothetical protein [Aggregatilinea sp.]HML21462.1 hypothetical protein [Aggregatilinea sp.]
MSQKSRWYKWQRGQALFEYWPTLPIAIAIMLSAGALTSFISNSFQKTVIGIEGTGLTCAPAMETDAETEGPSYAALGDHTVQMTGYQYDPEEDVTRVSYQVTSGKKPTISHWTLGIPVAFQSITSVEGDTKLEWGDDPTIGLSGLKFDTGYESAALPSGLEGYSLVSMSYRVDDGLTRNIYLTLEGHYELSIVNLGVKAGTGTYTGEIVAPVTPYTEPEETADPSCSAS